MSTPNPRTGPCTAEMTGNGQRSGAAIACWKDSMNFRVKYARLADSVPKFSLSARLLTKLSHIRGNLKRNDEIPDTHTVNTCTEYFRNSRAYHNSTDVTGLLRDIIQDLAVFGPESAASMNTGDLVVNMCALVRESIHRLSNR